MCASCSLRSDFHRLLPVCVWGVDGLYNCAVEMGVGVKVGVKK